MADNLIYHSLEKLIKEINAYYNWNYSLENDLKSQTNDKGKYMELYMIQRSWLDEWMKLCKYNKIKENLSKKNKKTLGQQEFIDNISLEKDNNSLYLPEISDEGIYDAGSNYNNINLVKLYDVNKIYIVNKECYDLFVQEKDGFSTIHGLYKKNKLIVWLENNNFYVSDFSNNNKKEYNLAFDEDNRRLNLVLEEIINTNNFIEFINKCDVVEEINGKKILLFKNQKFLFKEISYKKKKTNENNLKKAQVMNKNLNNENDKNIKNGKKKKLNNEKENIFNIMKDKMIIDNNKNNFNNNMNNFNNNNMNNFNNNMNMNNFNNNNMNNFNNNNINNFNNNNIMNNFNNNNMNNFNNNINNNMNNFINNVNEINNNNDPCLVGLNNIGATCYMNAVLQCFSNIKELTNYLFKPEVTKKIEDNKYSKTLSFAYLELLKHLWLIDKSNIEYYGENKSYSPYQFKSVLGKLNDLFLKNEANDSKDLIIFIQEQLHQELNFLFERQVKRNNNININQFSDKIVQHNFFEFFKFNYKSKISDLFYGTQKTITTCENCKKSTYNYQIFSNLIFPLEAIRESKGIPRNGDKTVYVTIEDCFDYNQQINYFKGQNQINCNYCKMMNNAYYLTKLYTASNILIIILNRGKGLQYKVNLNIDEEINISKYIENNESPFCFSLIGAIIHYGNSGQDGHFFAICKNKNNGKWYKYNDSIVSESNFNEIKSIGIPYVLFYKTKY